MKDLIVDYFQNIFASSRYDADPILRNVRPRVSDEHNVSLLAHFEPREIKEAIFSTHQDKSLGPNGKNQSFYQHYWDIEGV